MNRHFFSPFATSPRCSLAALSATGLKVDIDALGEATGALWDAGLGNKERQASEALGEAIGVLVLWAEPLEALMHMERELESDAAEVSSSLTFPSKPPKKESFPAELLRTPRGEPTACKHPLPLP